MKLVFAVVHDDDASRVMDELNRNGFMVTKMCSSGGFLKSGNTTLFVGVDEMYVEQVLQIIESRSKGRKQMISAPVHTEPTMSNSAYMTYPVEITVGGATVFVVDVEQFHKY